MPSLCQILWQVLSPWTLFPQNLQSGNGKQTKKGQTSKHIERISDERSPIQAYI